MTTETQTRQTCGEAPAGPLAVAPSPIGGRGVFARVAFAAGETVEVCPAVIVSPEEHELLERTPFYGMLYDWDGVNSAVALGYGSLYNHADDPNARFEINEERCVIVVTAVRDIAEGDEVTIRYSEDPGDLWF